MAFLSCAIWLQILQTVLAIIFFIDLAIRIFVRGFDFERGFILFGVPINILELVAMTCEPTVSLLCSPVLSCLSSFVTETKGVGQRRNGSCFGDIVTFLELFFFWTDLCSYGICT